MRLHNILLFLLAINTAVTHAYEIGRATANIANNKFISYDRNGVFTSNPINQGRHDWKYSSWRLKRGGLVRLPVNIEGRGTVFLKIVWAGWGNRTLVNIYYNNQRIIYRHHVHGHAWNRPKTDIFAITPNGCKRNCYITVQLDSASKQVLFMKSFSIDDGLSSNTSGLSQQPLFLPKPGEANSSRCIGHNQITNHSMSLVVEPDVGQVSRRVFQTQFDSSDWSGDLVAKSIDRDGNLTRTVSGSEVVHWSAANQLPQNVPSTPRKIFTVDSRSNLVTTLGSIYPSIYMHFREYLRGIPKSTSTHPTFAYEYEAMNYWRGNRSYEIGANRAQGFRSRGSLLGDIVNSVPIYVGPPSFNYPDNELCGTTTYSSFKNAHKDRPSMIYVGANDGMVHGFIADTGMEAMAFVPSYRQMHDFVVPSYSHRYYVDASPNAVDACVGNTWKTLLIGGLGAGGEAIYALNVTNPNSDFSVQNILAWEFKKSKTNTELGYTFGKPVIAKLASGQWVAIFGNGYNTNGNGKAYLYIVDIQNGRLIKKINTQTGSLNEPNGLSSVAAISTNNDHVTKFVYAGDLQGNLWKFDLTSNASSDWKVAFKNPQNHPRPLFKGTPAKPITATPTIVNHSTNGYMVYFGTGSYFAEGDHSYNNQTTQTFYAIWDGAPEKSPWAGKVREADLLEQRIVAETTLNNTTVRETTKYPINWNTYSGWKMDLAVQTPASGWVNDGIQPWPTGSSVAQNDGERSVVQPEINNNNIIYHTFTPGETNCSVGRHTWSMKLDADSGAGLTGKSGYRKNGILLHPAVIVPCSHGKCELMADDSGAINKIPSPNRVVSEHKKGRKLWRSINFN